MLYDKALVVFSGGQDSTTCLYWAKKHFTHVEALTIDYGQRHKIELEAAQKICDLSSTPQHFLKMDTFGQIGGNSLLDTDMEIKDDAEIPNTFVPGRNLIFMTYAASLAYTLNISHLVTGVCQTDYSGYPDCRRNTLNALEQSISLGLENTVHTHTPLMDLTKAESIQMAQEFGAMEALQYSHTCYEGKVPPCGKCPACVLRRKGFAEAKVPDPLLQRFV